ncbi:MAG TPA: hypothetical protein DCL29_02010 [Eubacterium sp.]|nr:hypothetical protein [Eubacterium sp.]
MEIKEKICLLYDGADSDFVHDAHQIHIIYHAESKNLEKFIETNQEKQIYLEIHFDDFNEEALKRIRELKQFDNWTLQLPVDMILDDKRLVDDIKFNAIKDSCNKYMFTDLVGNWEVLQFILALNPSEVRITNMLGFYLPDVKKVCGDVGIRVIANQAQSAWESSPALTKFFIRPEDVTVYYPYVSGFDFVGDMVIQDVCFKAYNRGYWFGDLKELIIGFNESLDSRRLPPDYGRYRLMCKKRCITGSDCHLCKAMRSFAEHLEKVDRIIDVKKLND